MLKDMLEECGTIKKGKFTLPSGEETDYFVDIKLASTYPDILDHIVERMAEHTDGDRIAGMALGAIPIATALALRVRCPFLMVRKKTKGYGKSKRLEGRVEKGEKITVVEDVTSSGGSAAETIDIIRERGASVDKVLTVVDREEGASELIDRKDAELIPLLTISDF